MPWGALAENGGKGRLKSSLPLSYKTAFNSYQALVLLITIFCHTPGTFIRWLVRASCPPAGADTDAGLLGRQGSSGDGRRQGAGRAVSYGRSAVPFKHSNAPWDPTINHRQALVGSLAEGDGQL